MDISWRRKKIPNGRRIEIALNLSKAVCKQMSEVTIRTANKQDLPRLVPLINQAFAIETFLDGTRTDEERLSATMDKGDVLIAECDGQALASVYVELRGERAYFGMLAVDPAQQGKGLGKFMTAAAEQYGRKHGCKRMEMSVLNLRPELLPFYRSLGYSETGTEEFRPPRRLIGDVACHCILMSKPL
jgi:ribosomal protein S18 acetylase RimI-like enzyme